MLKYKCYVLDELTNKVNKVEVKAKNIYKAIEEAKLINFKLIIQEEQKRNSFNIYEQTTVISIEVIK